MISEPTSLPDDEALRRGLASILSTGDSGYRQLRFSVLGREYNEYSSTYPSEVVNCLLEDGRMLHLHCKYSKELEHQGHRKGIMHEARVYQDILQESTSTTPGYYGIYNDLGKGNTWLVVEHIENALRIAKSKNGLLHAARWLGNFHRENSKHPATYSILDRYDAEYFLKWARQTKSFISASQNQLIWLEDLCDQYEEVVNFLLSAEQTIIHGEFYTSNILIRGENVYPIDWESAAVAAGEVDLAALTEAWPDPIFKQQCITEYQKYRWPGDAPASFRKTLSVARIHWQLRWLGGKPNWDKNKDLWRLDILMQEGEQLGLI